VVHSTPSDELELVATSVADDAGFVALCDLSGLLGSAEFAKGLLIGGHMVSLHARRWGLDFYRETQDADLGVPQLALNATEIGPKLEALKYERVRPNRFAKQLSGYEEDPKPEAIIDILVPAVTSRARKNVQVGDVVTIEVPGLAEALNRPPITVSLRLTRRNGDILSASVMIPDERSALTLKAMAWEVRRADKDAVDVWRCLEIAQALQLSPAELESDDGRRTLEILELEFGRRQSAGIAALTKALGLNESASIERATRIRGLIATIRGGQP